jgi:hypothetical protein
MRPLYQIKEEMRIGPDTLEEIGREVQSIIDNFSEYLKDYIPKQKGSRLSKSSVVGPVGKLLSAVTAERFETRDALLGFALSIHENTSDKALTKEGREKLEKAIEQLIILRKNIPARLFMKALREIDYGVYKRKFEYIISSGMDKVNGMTDKEE